MPEVRSFDVGTTIMTYVVCPKKRNLPRLHHTICEARCAGYKECNAYRAWYKETTGEILGGDKLKKTRRRRKTK